MEQCVVEGAIGHPYAAYFTARCNATVPKPVKVPRFPTCPPRLRSPAGKGVEVKNKSEDAGPPTRQTRARVTKKDAASGAGRRVCENETSMSIVIGHGE